MKNVPPKVLVAAELEALAKALVALGCPVAKSREMASMLDKRARQLASEHGRTYESALAHLLGLIKQGWAASGQQP